jgi:hypothetical protein
LDNVTDWHSLIGRLYVQRNMADMNSIYSKGREAYREVKMKVCTCVWKEKEKSEGKEGKEDDVPHTVL